MIFHLENFDSKWWNVIQDIAPHKKPVFEDRDVDNVTTMVTIDATQSEDEEDANVSKNPHVGLID